MTRVLGFKLRYNNCLSLNKPTDHDLPVISDYYSINLISLNKLTHKRTSPLCLHKGSGGKDLSQEQFTQSVLRKNSQGKPKKQKNGAKMASSHDGTCPREIKDQSPHVFQPQNL